jgi:hypothetical protein
MHTNVLECKQARAMVKLGGMPQQNHHNLSIE